VSDRLFRRVQARRKPVGRKCKSPSQRILARLGVLRCGSCGAAMVTDNKLYRCSSRECDCRASASANQVESLVLDRVAREIKGIRGHAGDVLTPALEEQERAQFALDKLRKVAALADDLEGFALQIREAKERVERADAAVDDARSVAGVTWSVSSIFHGLPGDPGFKEEPCFEGMSNEQLRDLIQTVFESITITRRENGVALEDRVLFKLHEAFDAQRPLDAAAADFAEVLSMLPKRAADLAADLPTPLLKEAAAG
jgi:hypothetical protein